MDDEKSVEKEPFDPRAKIRTITARGGAKAEYLDVKWRIVWFRREHPDGSIATEIVELTDKRAVFKATVSGIGSLMDGLHRATGHGSCTSQGFADYIEKAETKAIGRALNALGYSLGDAEPDDEIIDSTPAPVREQPRGNAAQAQAQVQQRAQQKNPLSKEPERAEGLCTAAQEKAMRSMITKKRLPGDEVVAHLIDEYGVEKLAELTEEQAREFIAFLNKIEPAQ